MAPLSDCSKKILSRLVIVLSLLLVSCGANEVIVTGSFPSPLIEPLDYTVGVFYSDEFVSHEMVDEATGKGEADWRVETGEAQVALWNNIFSTVFSQKLLLNEKPTEENPAKAVNLVIVPHVEELQYAIPSHTKIKVFEIWMRYRFELLSNIGEPLGSWNMTAYGKTPKTLVLGIEGGQSNEEAVNLAAIMSLRDAGANFVMTFRDAPPMASWLEEMAEFSKKSQRDKFLSEKPGAANF